LLQARHGKKRALSARRPITLGQQAKRHDESAALRRQVAELTVEVATLRDDKAALTEALRAARQMAKKQPAKITARRDKNPLAKYLWPSPRK
jgi:cell division protein FtsB